MAEDVAPTPSPGGGGKNFLKKDIGPLPLWGWALVLAGGIVLALYITKKNPLAALSGTGTTTDTAASTLAGQSGNGTVPTTYNNPVGGATGTTTTTTDTGTTGTSTGPGTRYTIRSSQASTGGPFSQYDKQNSGVPLRPSPDIKQGGLTSIPFGSEIYITAAPVSGDPNAGGGNSIWYPATYNGHSGYISASDLAGVGGGADRTYTTNVFGPY